MSTQHEQNTDCNGCPSKLKVGSNTILCVEMTIEPDQPVDGCSIRGKGRFVANMSKAEIEEIKAMYEPDSKESLYYDPNPVDPFERREW